MKRIIKKGIAITSIILMAACSKEDSVEVLTYQPPKEKPITVNILPQETHQKITGFGGANRMWGNETLSATEAETSFGLGKHQLGLSLFRVRLSSNKNDWDLIVNSIIEANVRNIKVLACPWSPPAALKNNNSDIGGYLLPENYKAFKEYINEFIEFMKSKGAVIDVVSIQNEPDWKANYESCDWTAEEIIAFLKAPGDIIGAELAGPESLNFNPQMTNAILSDPEASAKLDIVAGHLYGSGIGKFPLAEQQGKDIWMTEWLLNLGTGNSGATSWGDRSESDKWKESIEMLIKIQEAMTSNWNAFIWWYIKRYYSFIGDGEQGTVSGNVLKRGYAYSHFSKFIRPDYVRIGTEVLEETSPLKITAYKGTDKTIVVIVNPENKDFDNVEINHIGYSKAEKYLTSQLVNVDSETLPVINDVCALSIPAYSVITLELKN